LEHLKLVVFPVNDPILHFSFNKSQNLITLKTLKIVIEHKKENDGSKLRPQTIENMKNCFLNIRKLIIQYFSVE
jgi:hypothetical protein